MTRREGICDAQGFAEEDGTIQCALENALDRGLLPVYGSRMGISSRTDAGVHAYQNTLNVDLTHPFPDTIYKPSFITESVNRILAMKSHEITVLETRLVPSYFHSRINAKYRSYVYRLAVASDGDDGDQSTDSETSTSSNQSTKAKYYSLLASLPVSQVNRCHIVSSLDISLVRQCTELFVGRHDFANFSSVDSNNREKDTVKTLDLLQLHQCPPPLTSFELQTEAYSRLRFYELHIKAKSFLYNQVRRMVGALIDVGSGRLSLKDIEMMLSNPQHRCSGNVSPMVPACGLYLSEVGYDEEGKCVATAFFSFSLK